MNREKDQDSQLYSELKDLEFELNQVLTDHLDNMEGAFLNRAKNRVTRMISYVKFNLDSKLLKGFGQEGASTVGRYDGACGPDWRD